MSKFVLGITIICLLVGVGAIVYTTQNQNIPYSDVEQSNSADSNLATQEQPVLSSVSSSIHVKDCITKLADERLGYRGDCTGVGGYKLVRLEGDLRASVNIVSPDGKQHELNYWSVITGGFSDLEDSAEWRVQKQGDVITPKALIVQVNASENPANSSEITSYLAIAKITANEVCVTDKIKDGPKAVAQARAAADASGNKSCLSGY